MIPPRPRIDYYALGGTIASVSPEAGGAGAVPTLTASRIVDGIAGVQDVADVRTRDLLLTPSPEITIADLVGLVAAARAAIADGASGFVVTQGTDSIEETAFAVDLLWDRAEPIVFTGAMRNPSLPGAEGAANLLGAVQLAASPEAREAGVLVTLNDEIHAARHVRKLHASSPSAFGSPGLGPIGWISEGNPVVALRPTRRASLTLAGDARIPSVALVKIGLADDCRLLTAVADLGYDAVVIEGLGGGHIPAAGLAAIDRLVAMMPVVLTSRTGAGEVLASTYRFAGSEIDLAERGALRGGALDGPKARILLTLALAAGLDRTALVDLLGSVGTTATPICPPRA